MPHRSDGEVMDPSVSVPIANPQRPAAVAEAEPALEPLEPGSALNGVLSGVRAVHARSFPDLGAP